jgi:hypothetical protein
MDVNFVFFLRLKFKTNSNKTLSVYRLNHINPPTMLSSELWTLIGLHLKPRHLIKLVATCKQVQKAVDNDEYWTRVYTHLVWRTCDEMDIYGNSEELQRTDDLQKGLHNMLGLEQGYYSSMQRFFLRIEETIEYYSEHIPEYSSRDEREWWAALKHMSMIERSKANNQKFNGSVALDATTVKELAKMEMVKSMSKISIFHSETEAERRSFNKVVCEIEDDPMPPKYKRIIMRKIGELLGHRWFVDGERSHLCISDAGQMLSQF